MWKEVQVKTWTEASQGKRTFISKEYLEMKQFLKYRWNESISHSKTATNEKILIPTVHKKNKEFVLLFESDSVIDRILNFDHNKGGFSFCGAKIPI